MPSLTFSTRVQSEKIATPISELVAMRHFGFSLLLGFSLFILFLVLNPTLCEPETPPTPPECDAPTPPDEGSPLPPVTLSRLKQLADRNFTRILKSKSFVAVLFLDLKSDDKVSRRRSRAFFKHFENMADVPSYYTVDVPFCPKDSPEGECRSASDFSSASVQVTFATVECGKKSKGTKKSCERAGIAKVPTVALFANGQFDTVYEDPVADKNALLSWIQRRVRFWGRRDTRDETGKRKKRRKDVSVAFHRRLNMTLDEPSLLELLFSDETKEINQKVTGILGIFENRDSDYFALFPQIEEDLDDSFVAAAFFDEDESLPAKYGVKRNEETWIVFPFYERRIESETNPSYRIPLDSDFFTNVVQILKFSYPPVSDLTVSTTFDRVMLLPDPLVFVLFFHYEDFSTRAARQEFADKILANPARRGRDRDLNGIFVYTDMSKFGDSMYRELVPLAPDSELPSVGLLCMNKFSQRSFPYMHNYIPGSPMWEEQEIYAWIMDVVHGAIPPWTKSEPIPEEQPDPSLHKLVGLTYTDYVRDPTKDVIVYISSDSCHNCRIFESGVLRNVIDFFHDRVDGPDGQPLLSFAKIDGQLNDVNEPTYGITQFPTILIYPTNSKQRPKRFGGQKSYRQLMTFVSKWGSASREIVLGLFEKEGFEPVTPVVPMESFEQPKVLNLDPEADEL